MYWSGVKVEDNAKAGMSFIIKEDKIKYIQKKNFVNKRLLIIPMSEEANKEECTIILVYSPNEDAKKETKDRIYTELQKQVDVSEHNVN